MRPPIGGPGAAQVGRARDAGAAGSPQVWRVSWIPWVGRTALWGAVLAVLSALGSGRAGPGLALAGATTVVSLLFHALEISRLTLDEHGVTVRRLGGHDRIAWGVVQDAQIVEGRGGFSWIRLRCHGGRWLALPDVYHAPLSALRDAILEGRQAHARAVDEDPP